MVCLIKILLFKITKRNNDYLVMCIPGCEMRMSLLLLLNNLTEGAFMKSSIDKYYVTSYKYTFLLLNSKYSNSNKAAIYTNFVEAVP